MKVLAITGESGVGKTHISKILSKGKEFNLIKSYTTRKQRKEEKNNSDHIFVNQTTIDNIYNHYDIVASSTINDTLYWSTREQFKENSINVYVVDSVAYEELTYTTWDVKLVFVHTENPTRENKIHIPVGIFDYVDFYFDNNDHHNTFRTIAKLIKKMKNQWSWQV